MKDVKGVPTTDVVTSNGNKNKVEGEVKTCSGTRITKTVFLSSGILF